MLRPFYADASEIGQFHLNMGVSKSIFIGVIWNEILISTFGNTLR